MSNWEFCSVQFLYLVHIETERSYIYVLIGTHCLDHKEDHTEDHTEEHTEDRTEAHTEEHAEEHGVTQLLKVRTHVPARHA